MLEAADDARRQHRREEHLSIKMNAMIRGFLTRLQKKKKRRATALAAGARAEVLPVGPGFAVYFKRLA